MREHGCYVCEFADVLIYGQLVFNSYVLLIGYAEPGNANHDKPGIECYKGQLFVTKNTNKEEKEKEPKLKACGENQVCFSTYFRTDVTTGKGETILAGSWKKRCKEKSAKEISEHFGEDLSDQCVTLKEEAKEKAGIKVCTINADFCHNPIWTGAFLGQSWGI